MIKDINMILGCALIGYIYIILYLLTYVELSFDPSLQFSSNHHESS